jgi:hypothetical protein
MSNCLFITWDGPQTSYLEGLFLPIFKGLGEHGHRIHVLQFTWANADVVLRTKEICEAAGIPYQSAPVWRKAGAAGPLALGHSGTPSHTTCNKRLEYRYVDAKKPDARIGRSDDGFTPGIEIGL